MWSKTLVVLVAAAAFAPLLAMADPPADPGKDLTIHAENIQVQGTNPRTILGSFYIGPPVAGPGHGKKKSTVPTILSHGTGGACLIADLNFKGIPDLGGRCTTNAACTDAIPEKYKKDWYGYCVAGTCWTRPGPQSSLCLIHSRKNGAAPWSTGSHQIPTSPAGIVDTYRELGIGGNKPVKWRVHACMNGSDGPVDNIDCADDGSTGKSLNRLIDDGPPYSVSSFHPNPPHP